MSSSLRRFLLLCIGFAWLGAAGAQTVGAGRITLVPGWRLTPNDAFASAAAKAGHPLTQRSPGGPLALASFGYGAVEHLEGAVDLFATGEQLLLAGQAPLRSISYGGLIGARTQPELFPGFSASLGISTGVVLINISGGAAGQATERLTQGWGAQAGLHYQLSEGFSLGVEYRLILARGIVGGIGGVNGGGSWLGLALSFNVAASEPPSLSNFR